ncbi:MAG: hypothetical protein HY288_03845 [Planctomycetia bacterium]|nr:hypothetical protein [Planctomycetia bacterium]
MVEDRGTLRAIAWQEAFPGLALFSALRMALNIRALLLAAVAITGTTAGWRICNRIFSDTEIPELRTQMEANQVYPWERLNVTMPVASLESFESWRDGNPLVLGWNEISAPFERLYASEATFTGFVYWLVCALWSLVVWGFFGGAITRMAAVSFARRESPSWKQLAGFVRQRFGAYFSAPLLPILGTFLVAIFLAVLGFIMRVGPGILVAGIVWPLVLIGGFMMAFLLIVLFFGWPLMWGSISAEGTDSFGALSHAYSYTYQRPLHYLMYAVGSALIGVLGWFLVSLFAFWIISLSRWGVSWGSGAAQINEIFSGGELGTLGNAGSALIQFWLHCVNTLALAFVFSYLWTSTTVIYFLLRRLVDATELDEVFMPEESELHGLPPLKTGPDGVAQVADDPVMAGDG